MSSKLDLNLIKFLYRCGNLIFFYDFNSMSSTDVARMTVNLGDHNIRSSYEVQHITKRVKRVVRHRSFDPRTLYNDIALLTLESPIQYSRSVRPICLPTTAKNYGGQWGMVAGWGSLRENGPQPSTLQKGVLKRNISPFLQSV